MTADGAEKSQVLHSLCSPSRWVRNLDGRSMRLRAEWRGHRILRVQPQAKSGASILARQPRLACRLRQSLGLSVITIEESTTKKSIALKRLLGSIALAIF